MPKKFKIEEYEFSLEDSFDESQFKDESIPIVYSRAYPNHKRPSVYMQYDTTSNVFDYVLDILEAEISYEGEIDVKKFFIDKECENNMDNESFSFKYFEGGAWKTFDFNTDNFIYLLQQRLLK